MVVFIDFEDYDVDVFVYFCKFRWVRELFGLGQIRNMDYIIDVFFKFNEYVIRGEIFYFISVVVVFGEIVFNFVLWIFR